MKWQDAILSFGSIFFTLALIPTIRAAEKPALVSSIMTALFLLSFVVVDFSLGLPVAAVLTVTTAVAWLILAAQKIWR